MEFQEDKKGDVFILRVEGRVDAVTAPALEKKIQSIVEDGGEKQLILSFQNVEYLSSAGMRLLLATMKKLKAEGGKMVVSDLQDPVMDVIKMAGFNFILTLADTEEKALQGF